MNLNSLEYEDQIRAVAMELALQHVKGRIIEPDGIMAVADEFASYIANGLTCAQYKEVLEQEFNVYKRHKAMDDDGG